MIKTWKIHWETMGFHDIHIYIYTHIYIYIYIYMLGGFKHLEKIYEFVSWDDYSHI